uniref:Uncharacterized protein n=1 Tax=Moniliophthora roreri TaxID=221103 RepID=A0A0W0FR51_MONRR
MCVEDDFHVPLRCFGLVVFDASSFGSPFLGFITDFVGEVAALSVVLVDAFDAMERDSSKWVWRSTEFGIKAYRVCCWRVSP